MKPQRGHDYSKIGHAPIDKHASGDTMDVSNPNGISGHNGSTPTANGSADGVILKTFTAPLVKEN